VRALLAGSEIFCVPGAPVRDGRVEGFGLAYLEAAAQGLPSIGPRLWAVPEVIRDRETGFLVDPADVDDIAYFLTTLLSEPDLRMQMGERARQWSRSFTWDRCAEQTYEATA
jgi:phosphatidyl-myo-inositol dimannoside synthase